jgi:hypothetical protein
MQASEKKGAVKIQSMQRSKLAKKKMRAKQQQKALQEEQKMDSAAQKIQQRHRVRGARKEVEKRKDHKKRLAGIESKSVFFSACHPCFFVYTWHCALYPFLH